MTVAKQTNDSFLDAPGDSKTGSNADDASHSSFSLVDGSHKVAVITQL